MLTGLARVNSRAYLSLRGLIRCKQNNLAKPVAQSCSCYCLLSENYRIRNRLVPPQKNPEPKSPAETQLLR